MIGYAHGDSTGRRLDRVRAARERLRSDARPPAARSVRGWPGHGRSVIPLPAVIDISPGQHFAITPTTAILYEPSNDPRVAGMATQLAKRLASALPSPPAVGPSERRAACRQHPARRERPERGRGGRGLRADDCRGWRPDRRRQHRPASSTESRRFDSSCRGRSNIRPPGRMLSPCRSAASAIGRGSSGAARCSTSRAISSASTTSSATST